MTRKVCVFGAGSTGGYLAAMLADANAADVSLAARGEHLAAIKAEGLRVKEGDRTISARLPASDDAADLGQQDFVIVSVKAHAIAPAVNSIKPLLGPETAVVFAVNGIPWWYFFGVEGPLHGRQLNSIDPGGRIWAGIGPERAIGCVVYPASEVVAPGIVQHIEGDRLALGEPSGDKTERIRELSGIFTKAGLKAPVRKRIRDEIWVKLWGNCSFNPLSVLTHATLEDMCRDTGVRQIARAAMVEAQAVGEALGVHFPIDVDARIAGAEAVGAHKTSMLQDLERGRPLELDAVLTAVLEMARLVGVATPTLQMLHSLVVLRARSAGLYNC